MNYTDLKTLMPSGAKIDKRTMSAIWEKQGGYADKTIKAFFRKMFDLGFVRSHPAGFNSPDGSVIGARTLYTAPDGDKITVTHSYGVVKEGNFFAIEYHAKETK